MKFFWRLKWAMFSGLLRSRKFDVRNALVITCEPRSGSTWLMELLGSRPEILLNWEPLHKLRGVAGQCPALGWRPVIAANPGPDIERLFHDILTVRRSTPWTLKYVSWADIFRARFVLTKFVRANGSLLWMIEQFQFRYRPIYLVRHPVSVAASQLRQFGQLSLEDVKSDAFDLEAREGLAELQESLDSNLQLRVLLWCVMNAPLLERARSAHCPFLIIFYEDLVSAPLGELNKIREAWGISSDFGMMNFTHPSRSDFKREFLTGAAEGQLNKHLEALEERDALQIQRIMDFFDIREYHVQSPYPRRQ